MKIGTRGSELALWQARRVQDLLQRTSGITAEIVVVKTAGDQDPQTAFAEMPGKGFFTKEIEDALLAGTVDLAVHSLKDLQTVMPPGLTLAAIPERADRRDVLLITPSAFDDSRPLRLRDGARVGTSSARRIAQLRHLRPDLEVRNLRGNVPTRVRKLREGRYDAVLIAAAGLDRLGLSLDDLATYRLPEMVLVPAPGQGALAVQVREGDEETRLAVRRLDDPALRRAVWAEREVLRRLEGGCQLALGTFSELTENGLRLGAFLGTADPSRPRRAIVAGRDEDAVVEAAVSYLKGFPPAETLRPSELSPVRLWITREPQRAQAFRQQFDPPRFEVAAVPVFVAIEAGDAESQRRTMQDLATYDWIFFTSQVTVDEFARLMQKHSARIDARTRLAAVGRKTKTAMERHGWNVHFTSDVADAQATGEQFLTEAGRPIGRILLPCGRAASPDLEVTLAAGGTVFDRLVCYDTVESPQLAPTVMALTDPDAVVFTSPQAARFLLNRRPLQPETIAVSIGPATTEALLRAGLPIVYETFDRSLEGTAEVIHGLFPEASSPTSAPQSSHS